MWAAIAQALLKELENNPDKVLGLLSEVIDLLKSHPEAVQPLVTAITGRLNVK